MLQKTAATDGRPASRLATGKKLVERLLSEATVEGPANSGDLIVTGPAAEADVARLQASNPYLDAPLLTFRAARDGAPTWQTTLPDMGWSGFARSVQACAVESDHLGIVRPPHAKQIAAIIMREIGRT
jgi:thioesterase domain-containing protein